MKMLRGFRQKLQRLSLGKRKFLLDKMNACLSIKNQPDFSVSSLNDAQEQFIYAASLLIDDKKTLKETVALVKDCFSVTSAQYEYYFSILNLYENSLTAIGRKRFCSSIMKKNSSQKSLAISAKIRQNTKH